MAGTSVSIGANGRLLLLLMEVVLLSFLVVVVVSSASFAIAACGSAKHEIAVENDASMQALRSIMCGASLSCDENAPSDSVIGMHPTLSPSSFLVRLELDAVRRWTKASAYGTKQSDEPDKIKNESAMRLFVMLLVWLWIICQARQQSQSP